MNETWAETCGVALIWGLSCRQESRAVCRWSRQHGVHQTAAARLSAQRLPQTVCWRRSRRRRWVKGHRTDDVRAAAHPSSRLKRTLSLQASWMKISSAWSWWFRSSERPTCRRLTITLCCCSAPPPPSSLWVNTTNQSSSALYLLTA